MGVEGGERMKKAKGCRCPWCGGRTRVLYRLISGEGNTSGMSYRECTIKACLRKFFA
jgi:hypothetical protein